MPQLATGDLCGAVLNPVAGTVTPDLVVQGCARSAAARGAEIVQSCAVTRIVAEGGRVVGVETERGRSRPSGSCSRRAPGPASSPRPPASSCRWSPSAGTCSSPRTRPTFPAALPLTIDFSTGFYFHREGAALVFGGREQSLDEIAPVAARRLPPLVELGVRSSWWGLYEMSPDHNALIGAAAEPAGLLYATGFSGHGFQQGLVVGEHLAQLALGLEPAFDLSQFSVERFAAGVSRTELNIV